MCQIRAQITIETAVIYNNFPPNTAGSNPVITTDVMNLNTFKVKQILKRTIMIILTSDMPSDTYFYPVLV